MTLPILSQKIDEAAVAKSRTAVQKMRRYAINGSAVGAVAGYLAYPQETQYALLSAGSLGTIGAGYFLTDWALSFPHRWKWVYPLHETLKGPLALGDEVRAGRYIKIHRNYAKREEVGKIMLPAHFTGVDLKTVEVIVKHKLGLSDASVSFHLAGRRPHVIIRQTPRPPGKVLFGDFIDKVTASAESAPLIGVGPQARHVQVDLDAESPHILVSASTGGGKSVITRGMSAQMLHNGAQLVVLDFKRHSHKWARGLPQVDYCRDIHEIHETLIALGREGHRRNLAVDDHEGEGEPDVGPRMAILLEEANATISKLKRHWTAIRKTRADDYGPADPKESPAIDALREILFMGRAVKMHVLLVAQSATAAALGGPEVRECFATRILARYTVNAWRMLVPEVHPVPRSTRHVGRAQVVLGGVATETQVIFFSDAQARDWASSGVVAPPPDLSRDIAREAPTREYGRDSHASVTPMVPSLTLIKGEKTMSLAEASRLGIVPMKPDALRQAKRRDPEFPAGDEGRWTAAELQRWFRNRPSA
jgi:hypothetical protein